MARSAVVGEPTRLQAQRYAAIAAGQKAEIEAIRPGALAGDVFEVALRTTREAGLPTFMRNHCGHGVGVECNENPRIMKHSKVALGAGMVLSLETPFYERGWGGMMVEDVVRVTEDGFEFISTLPRDLMVL